VSKMVSLDVSEDRLPCSGISSAPTHSLPLATASTSTLAAAVPTSSAMTPAAASAHSAASAASSFPSDPFPPASETRQALSSAQYLQPLQQPSLLQPRAIACDIPDHAVFSEPDTNLASVGEASLAGANSIGGSPLRGGTSLFGQDSLGDFGLSQQPTYSASTVPTFSTEQRSSELRGAFTDMSWSVHPSSGSITPGVGPQASSLGSPAHKSVMMHGMPMQHDTPAQHYLGLPQPPQGSGSSFSGSSLAGHNRQNVPPNFPQHSASPAATHMNQDHVRFCPPAPVPGCRDVCILLPAVFIQDGFSALNSVQLSVPSSHSHMFIAIKLVRRH
jgi:hypothetical protein